MTKFFEDYFTRYILEDDMIAINDLWECICDKVNEEEIFNRYEYPFADLYLQGFSYEGLMKNLRRVLTVEVAELMKSIAWDRYNCTENINYHITKDEMMSMNNIANSMQSEDELLKITSDKFNNDIDKYDIQLGKHEIAKKIVDEWCPIPTGDEYEEEH